MLEGLTILVFGLVIKNFSLLLLLFRTLLANLLTQPNFGDKDAAISLCNSEISAYLIKRFHLFGQDKDVYNLHKIVTYFL